ncbi:MAG: ABC transporter permease [Campylobacterales bacterium]|nr:ABC transporter permease [Campylobacterales bacterium]NLM99873.1 FtsX-like permease family protein [Campylobacteraceae bacterium]
MINLAIKDIIHSFGKFLLTGVGLGLLVGITLIMAGVYRGMVDDGKVLLDNSRANLWVVQKETLGPYAESSTIPDDLYRSIGVVRGVKDVANVTYLTMQLQKDGKDVRAMVAGISSGEITQAGWPPYLIAGRHVAKGHYEAVADIATGFKIGDKIKIRRNHYEVVGLTHRHVSSSGDPIVYIPLKDAKEAQFLKDNEAILMDRRRVEANPAFKNSAVSAGVNSLLVENRAVNAILVNVEDGFNAQEIANEIRKWKSLTVYDKSEMEEILIGKLIATSAKQISMFLVILAVVSATIVAFIIYTLTMEKAREIAVLKLLGTRNRTIAWMILQQSLILGLIGFMIGKISAYFMADFFPKYVLLTNLDTFLLFLGVMTISIFSSLISINLALKIDPAEAIG